MLKAICPVDGTTHHADEAQAGRWLRCATCGKPVEIPSRADAKVKLERAWGDVVVDPSRATTSNKRRAPWRWFRWAQRKWMALAAISVVALGCWLAVFSPLFNDLPANPSHEPVSNLRETDPNLPMNQPGTGIVPTAGPAFFGSAPVETFRRDEDAEELHRSLPTGTRIRPDRLTDGKGVVSIDNTQGSDAEVKIISQDGGYRVRDFFVSRGGRFNSRNLPVGTYRVQFAIGENWDLAKKEFTRGREFFDFGKDLVVRETSIENGIEVTHHTLTLYEVADGTVKRQPISESDFVAR